MYVFCLFLCLLVRTFNIEVRSSAMIRTGIRCRKMRTFARPGSEMISFFHNWKRTNCRIWRGTCTYDGSYTFLHLDYITYSLNCIVYYIFTNRTIRWAVKSDSEFFLTLKSWGYQRLLWGVWDDVFAGYFQVILF